MGVDLSVELAGLRLKNPVLVASGTFGYGIEFAEQVDLNRLGGIVVKGLSAQPMEGAPAPPAHRQAFAECHRHRRPGAGGRGGRGAGLVGGQHLHRDGH